MDDGRSSVTVDEKALDAVRSSLGADGYRMTVGGPPGRPRVEITADPGVCSDCLVPPEVLALMLAPALGVPADRIDLHYPMAAQDIAASPVDAAGGEDDDDRA